MQIVRVLPFIALLFGVSCSQSEEPKLSLVPEIGKTYTWTDLSDGTEYTSQVVSFVDGRAIFVDLVSGIPTNDFWIHTPLGIKSCDRPLSILDLIDMDNIEIEDGTFVQKRDWSSVPRERVEEEAGNLIQINLSQAFEFGGSDIRAFSLTEFYKYDYQSIEEALEGYETTLISLDERVDLDLASSAPDGNNWPLTSVTMAGLPLNLMDVEEAAESKCYYAR